MKVHCPKSYNMAHLLSSNVLQLPKDLTIIFIIHVHVYVLFCVFCLVCYEFNNPVVQHPFRVREIQSPVEPYRRH